MVGMLARLKRNYVIVLIFRRTRYGSLIFVDCYVISSHEAAHSDIKTFHRNIENSTHRYGSIMRDLGNDPADIPVSRVILEGLPALFYHSRKDFVYLRLKDTLS